MPDLYLIRHAQASFGQQDYDQLSELGAHQSQRLGEYFCEELAKCDSIVTGQLKRHQQTLDGMALGSQLALPAEASASLNEYDFQSILTAYRRQQGLTEPLQWHDSSAVFHQLSQAMHAWQADQLDSQMLSESWLEFNQRVTRFIEQIIASPARKVVAVTSGGVIAAITAQVLNAPAASVVQLNRQIANTGVSHFKFGKGQISLTSFNSVAHFKDAPHLDITHH
ncbi:histidine phosphatase family protein [Paraferrimonas sedimenticola]|uniref:Phosphoglycerate mutase n=1 Tax=Paraferrimonas sedimenticola TaxID=375674 RepID=A0AA37RWP4_9GAMM|nr:histidine phosphatase family protein [Paraferrimonas sedimenticola]GLP96633.1 phosphoglycerate mutase [Paraferrimonas sedimenticola]